MQRHAGTIAVVTGAAHGIGRAIALRLAAEGAAVAVLDIDGAGAEETARMLAERGARAAFRRADITDAAATEEAFAALAAEVGRPTLLVNNAAFTSSGDLASITVEAWRHEIDVTLHGTWHCTRAVLPWMVEARRGAIVNIASVNALRYFGNPSYSAAKAGVLNLTQSVASEYGRHGIRCNAVCPGSVRTDNVTWRIRQDRDPDVFRKLARWYPLGRVAEPDDVARAVSFLGSDEAAYITGAMLPVDGGLLAGMNVMIEEFILETRPDAPGDA